MGFTEQVPERTSLACFGFGFMPLRKNWVLGRVFLVFHVFFQGEKAREKLARRSSPNFFAARQCRFARDDKEPGPSWGKKLPGERPRETAET